MSLRRFSRLSSTVVDIGMQMKQFNDTKQFNKALSLFNLHLQQQPNTLIINQALKACINLNDLQGAKIIHQRLSPFLLNNHFIRTNLIRLYNAVPTAGMNVLGGRSSTIVNGELVHLFANDRSHPRSNEIYRQLGQLENELVQHGYQCDQSWISRPLKDGETSESALWGHSERITIAFQLIQQPKPSVIQIVKNLRICDDCHTAIQLIAQIRQCVIIVHDANRIHHFDPTGKCSCNDRF